MQDRQPSTTPRGQTGFTLIELLVTVTVLAIILIFAVPSFLGIINNNRITSSANELITSFSIARAEAIKANTRAQILPSDTSWDSGYTIRIDTNRDEDFVDTGEVIKVIGPISEVITFYSDSTSVIFDSLGALDPIATQTFCMSGDRAFRRVITLSPSGSSSIEVDDSASKTCP